MNNLNSSPQLFKVPTPLGWATLPLIVDATGGRWLALGLVSHTLGLSMGGYTLPRTEKPSWGRRRVDGHECLPVDRCPQFFTSIKEGSVPAPARPFLFWARLHAFRAMSDFTIPTPAVPLIAEEEDVPESYPVSAPVVASSELIQIRRSEFGGQEANSVSGRDLHAFLEVGKEFANWIKDQIETFGFVEHQDFEVIAEIGKNPQGGRPTKEYMISISMAKELAMVQRTSKGKEARLYFIECERRANEPSWNVAGLNVRIPKTLSEAMRTLADMADKAQELGDRVATLQPKADGLDRIATMANDSARTLTDAAKILQQAPRKFFTYLQVEGWIYRQNGRWMAYQGKITQGLMEHKFCNVQHDSGPEFDVAQALITPKGIAKLAVMLCVPVAA